MTEISIISYILLSLVVYSGATLGYLISSWLREETKEYKKQFVIISSVLLALVIPLLVFFMNPTLIFTAISGFLLLLAVILMIRPRSVYIYPFLGLSFFMSMSSQNLLILQTIIMFLYGLGSSAVEFKHKKKESKKNYTRILYILSFFITALVPLLLKIIF